MGGLGSSLFAAAAERRGGVRGASGVFEGAEQVVTWKFSTVRGGGGAGRSGFAGTAVRSDTG